MLNRDLKLIFTCNVIGASGDGLFAYLLPVYMSSALGADPVQIGILYAVMSLFAALTLLVAGTLADKYDRKKIMIAGWLAWLPAPLIFSLATDWLHMLPGMVMWGFWLGGPTHTAYIVTATDKTRLTQIFATMSAAWSIGYIYSPALGGYFADTIGTRYIFYFAFILYSLAALTLSFISSQRVSATEQSTQERYSISNLLRTRQLQVLSVFFAALLFCLMMSRPFIPKYLVDARNYGGFETGLLGSVTFASSAVLGILFGKLGDKTRKSYALTVSIVLTSISLGLLVLSGSFTVLVVTSLLAGSSYTVWSLMSATVGPLAPQSCRARWVSIPQTISMFTSFIAPYIGGFLYATSPELPFILSILILFPLFILTLTKLLEQRDPYTLRNS